ncbi:hypothetical protein Taro_045378 [Colocasia esculenta]|uniref:Peptidase A1 domain-containing protein n=1 Tax=Colocasia esculenta TaxID=4460 RepID=A0A843WLW0_COLES|nr:hypothetical protein [Colocasia esculenta]
MSTLLHAFHGKNSLKVVHRLGPCSPSGDGGQLMSDEEILGQDAERVAYFQKRMRVVNKAAANLSGDPMEGSLDVTLPARTGAPFGSGSYVVTIGLGTPRVEQTVVFDSGSSLCWVQCKPCQSCYSQKEPIFDPVLSRTYRKVGCNDEACTPLHPMGRGCSNHTCTYCKRRSRPCYVDVVSRPCICMHGERLPESDCSTAMHADAWA